jgi:hypothetical protein
MGTFLHVPLKEGVGGGIVPPWMGTFLHVPLKEGVGGGLR